MNDFVAMTVLRAEDFFDEAKSFYQACGRKTELQPDDILVTAFIGDQLSGLVRLCFENKCFVLRTMQIRNSDQRRGLGTLLLQRFDGLIREKKIDEIYCMPYSHLEKFYGQIGFQKIRIDNAPIFLQQRAESFASTHTDQSVILMVKKGL